MKIKVNAIKDKFGFVRALIYKDADGEGWWGVGPLGTAYGENLVEYSSEKFQDVKNFFLKKIREAGY